MAETQHLSTVTGHGYTATVSDDVTRSLSECSLLAHDYVGLKWKLIRHTRQNDPSSIYYTLCDLSKMSKPFFP